MKRILNLVILGSFLTILITACGDDKNTSSDSEEIKLTASVGGLGSSISSNILNKSVIYDSSEDDVSGTALSPSVYKLALVNFWLLKDDGTEVNIINPDEDNPAYTETSPLIIDFSSNGQVQELLSDPTIPAGTYTGYKMQFLYIEMDIPAAFHVPDSGWETYIDVGSILDTTLTRSFRLYFNAVGKYWKRDFVVELDPSSGEWYWLRREIEDQDGSRKFFIKVEDNDHPPGVAGPDSIIDLYDDPPFWGAEDSYKTSDPIIVGTHSNAGGLDVSLDEQFTIPEELNASYYIDLEVNVLSTMFFDETQTAAVTLTSKVVDLGPDYSGESYGDIGLHPKMPKFTITVTN